MRLLVFSDLHLDAAFAWAPPEVASRRRQAIRQCLTRICDLAISLRVDALCGAGDLYEQERFTPDTRQFLRDAFARLGSLPVFLAPGNHDWLGPVSLYRQVAWSDNVHIFAEPALRPVRLADGFTLWGAAHCAPAATPGFLEGFRVSGDGVHVGLFHGSEQGELTFEGAGKIAHAPFRASEIPSTGLHHALVGHFHTPRDAPHHTYPGNPEPLTFGETGERGAVLVTVGADGSITRERHRVAVSQVHDVEVDLSGAEHSSEVRGRIQAQLAGLTGSVRVTLVGEVGPDAEVSLAGIHDLAPTLDAVVAGPGRVTVRYDLDLWAVEQTVRGQFIRDVRAAEHLSEEQRKRVLLTGLRALDGRDDLEVH